MLEFLFQVARQFPEEGLAPHSLFLFVSLAMRLVNEREANVKEQVQGVLKCLLGRIPQKQFFEVLDLSLKWIPHRSFILEEEEEKPKPQKGKGKKKRKRSLSGEEDSASSSSSPSDPPSVLEPLTPKRRVGFLVLSLIIDVCGHAENKTEATPSTSSSGLILFVYLFTCLFLGYFLKKSFFYFTHKYNCRRNNEVDSAYSSLFNPSQPPL